MEVKLGCKDPSKAHDPKDNPYQRGDGVFGNWTRSQRPTVYDGTCVTAVHYGMLRPLAHGTRLATDYPEAAKRRAKAAACDANNFDFMTWASSTRGGIGREAAAWFTSNFATKIAKASSDSERWRIRSEQAPPAGALSHHCKAQHRNLQQQRTAEAGGRSAAGASPEPFA